MNDVCQKCDDAPQETTVIASIGGIPAGPLYVCEDCEEQMMEGRLA